MLQLEEIDKDRAGLNPEIITNITNIAPQILRMQFTNNMIQGTTQIQQIFYAQAPSSLLPHNNHSAGGFCQSVWRAELHDWWWG